METSTNLLKSVILAESQYRSSKIERNLVNLQRLIDTLISKTNRGCSLKFLSPCEVLAADCLACLVNLVSDPATKQTLLLKCLLLFNNLVSDAHICECLHNKFELTPALVNVIRHHGSASSDTLTVEALHLLQKVTYGQRISFEESYMEDLVRFLLDHVTYPTAGSTQPTLGVLVNLTRDNFSVLSYIKNNVNMQDLARRLTKLLGEETQTTVLFSLTLLLNVCVHEKMGGKFYNESNAPRTFQMIFNILIDGDSGETRKYAVDLMKDILKVDRLQRYLANFEYLGTCLEQTLNLLSTSSPASVVKVFEFLQTLCHVEGVRLVVCTAMFSSFQIQDQSTFASLAQMPLSRIADPLLATIHWAGQSTDTHGLAALGAYDLLIEIYEELVFSHDKIHHDKHVAAVLPTALQTLKLSLEGDNGTIQRRCTAMVKCTKLLLSFCHDDNFLTLISKHIDSSILTGILNFQFDNNMITIKTNITPPTDDWSSTGVELVLQLLDLIGRLKNKVLENVFMTVMQETRVVPFLASGLCSSNRQTVQDTMSLLILSCKLEGFPAIILGDALACHNAQRDVHTTNNNNASMPCLAFPRKRQFSEDKENMKPMNFSHQTDMFGISSMSIDNSKSSNASVESLIDGLKGGLGISENNTPEIVAVYERTLQTLQTKDQHLQDLLEAKTLALTQADRMLAQFKARKGQEEAESNQLRKLLIQTERMCDRLNKDKKEMDNKIERYAREIDEVLMENQKLQEVANMHMQLTAAHTELSVKYEQQHKAYQVMTQQHKSLTDMHEMLQKHNQDLKQQYDTTERQLQDLQDERRKVANQLKSVETKYNDCKKAAHKWEYDYKQSEEERETMEISIEKLRTDMAKSDTKIKNLVEQVSQLEFACSQNEAKICNYESEINELKKEVDKHRQIAALINSLSSGGPANGAESTTSSKTEHQS